MLALVSMGDAGGDSLALARRGDVCGSPILVSLFPSVPPWCFASAGSAQLGLSLPVLVSLGSGDSNVTQDHHLSIFNNR